MRKLFVLLLLFFVVGCGKPISQYDAEDLSRLVVQTQKGIITRQSKGSFYMKDASGEDRRYATSMRTEYIPADYRTQEGDKVKIMFREIWRDSAGPSLSVLQIKALPYENKNKVFKNPMTGTIATFSYATTFQYVISFILKPSGEKYGIQFFIPRRQIQVGRQKEVYANKVNWDDFVGKKVKVFAHEEPLYRGNGYYYVVDGISALN